MLALPAVIKNSMQKRIPKMNFIILYLAILDSFSHWELFGSGVWEN